MTGYKCETCGKDLSNKRNLIRHEITHQVKKIHFCPLCHRGVTRKDNLIDHMIKCHKLERNVAKEKCKAIIPMYPTDMEPSYLSNSAEAPGEFSKAVPMRKRSNDPKPQVIPADQTPTTDEHESITQNLSSNDRSRKRTRDEEQPTSHKRRKRHKPRKRCASEPAMALDVKRAKNGDKDDQSTPDSPELGPGLWPSAQSTEQTQATANEVSSSSSSEDEDDAEQTPPDSPELGPGLLPSDQPRSTVELIEEDDESPPRTPDYHRAPSPHTSVTPPDSPELGPGLLPSDQPRSTVELIEEDDESPPRTPDYRRSPSPQPGPSNRSPSPQPGPSSWDPKQHYEMTPKRRFTSRKLRTEQIDYRIKIKSFGTDNFADIRERLGLIFQSIIDEARAKATPDSIGLVSLTMRGLDDYINSRVDNIHDMKADGLLNLIEKVLNSNQEASPEDFNMRIIYTEQPSGGQNTPAFHNRSGRDLDPKKFRARKLSLMDVSKDAGELDKMCLARCLYVGKHMADNPGNFRKTTVPKFKTMADSRHANQRYGALNLCQRAGVDPDEECGLHELQQFQNLLGNYQIVCYESFAGQTSVCFPTEHNVEKHDKRIYLWLYQHHFTLINPSMLAGFHGRDHFCHDCMKAWDGTGVHKCEKALCDLCCDNVCKNEASRPSAEPVHCKDCNRYFKSVHCRTAHKESKVCGKKYFCDQCQSLVPQKKKDPALHHCLLNKCWHCQEFFEPGEHQCYVQRPKKGKKARNDDDLEVPEEEEDIHFLYGEFNEENGYEDDFLDADGEPGAQAEKKKRKYFYCDIEADNNDSKHDPIMLCMESEDGSKEWEYYGDDCLNDFFNDINANDEFKDSTFVFHNFAGYDGIHLLKIFYDRCVNPKPLFRGCRVLTMSLADRGIRFLDSYLHMVIPLSKIADCYGIEDAIKGWFPYLLCTKANRDYVGPFPAMEFFDPDNMLPEQKAAFLKWYNEEKAKYDADPNKKYDLRAEMRRYCMNDCTVLRKGFTKYRETMKLQNSGMDPAEKITLPSYINQVYRALNMPEKSLAILPPRGYNQRGMQSHDALAWLLWQSKQLGLPIIHGRNSAEVKVGPYYLDGFAKTHSGGKVALEFNGCPWHGCPRCYENSPDEVFQSKTYRDRQKETKDKETFLKDRGGYQVISIYSCQFKKEQEENTDLEDFVEDIKARLRKATPLAPRDSLRGGRTNAVVMYYVPKEGETIYYMDFTSLYPAVNCCLDDDQFYPVGHPQIMLDPDEYPPLYEVFGIIKCRILPPKQLFLPVLPVLANGKVIFGLCGTCISEDNSEEMCTHSDHERVLVDTFVSLEVQKAMEMGYVVQEVYEIYHWPEEQRSKTLFRDQIIPSYIKKFQASGWPKAYKTEEERRALLQRYKDEQNIDIPYDSVYEVPNPAERTANKLTANNFWGFLGKQAQGCTVQCTTYEQYLKYANDKTKTVTNMWMTNERILYMELQDKPEYEKIDPKTSVVHATFTTSMARLKLFKELQKTDRRTLYFDTDSIIWVQRPGEPDLETGPLLGQLTDEIFEKYGKKYGTNAIIKEYAAAGPKTYALVIADKRTGETIDTIVKCKGIRLTAKATDTVTGETLIDLVKENKEYKVPQVTMKRDKKTGTIFTKKADKRLRVTFSKRIWPDRVDVPSLPIGWQEQN